MRVADDSALASTERYVNYRTLPCHPHGKRPYRINGLLRVEPDAPLAGSSRVVVLTSESPEHLNSTVIHPYRDAEVVLPKRFPQKTPRTLIQT